MRKAIFTPTNHTDAHINLMRYIIRHPIRVCDDSINPKMQNKNHSCYFFALLVMTFIIECKQFSVFKHFTLHFFRLIFILMPFDSNIVVGWIDWLAGAGRHQHSALHAIFNKKWQYRWKKTHTYTVD